MKNIPISRDIPREKGTAKSCDISEALDHCKRELDVLFKKAMNNLWRSTMHVNWSVTPFLGPRLKKEQQSKIYGRFIGV